MTTIDLHPEHLIDREREGTLDAAGRARLIEHRERCATCAVEHAMAESFELEPDDEDRARAARLVAAMFEGTPLRRVDPVPAPEPARRARAFAWMSASIAAHAVLLALVMMLPTSQGDPRATPLDPIDITLRAPSTAPSSSSEPRSADGAPASASAAVIAAPRVRRARARTTDVVAIGPSVPHDVEHDVVTPITPSIDGARLSALLDPAHVAREGLWIEGAPSRRGAPAGLGGADPRVSERDLERSLEAGLRTDAMTKAYTARSRPDLHRRADGSQEYRGPRFTAIIGPDGSVHFEDRPSVATNGFSASGTFDLTESIMGAAGQDPLRAEREWFMRNTEELRNRLESEHRRREMDAALARLPGRLARVWATTTRSPASRRRHIFELWDEMEEDEAGARARRVVIEFVREALPAGSDDAYTDDELARLNASRESREPFAPY